MPVEAQDQGTAAETWEAWQEVRRAAFEAAGLPGLPDHWQRMVEESCAAMRAGVTEQHIQAQVREWAERGVISKWAVPEVRFVDLLENTSVGKLDKKVLRQKYG